MRHACLMAVVLAAGSLACNRASSPATPSPVATVPGPQTVALVAALQKDATAQVAEVMRADAYPFAARAVRIRLNDENIYAFEYGSVAEAQSEAGRISADGYLIGTSWVDWVSDPHFYRSGPLVVCYVGRTSNVRGLLERLLGSQVAGR